MGMLHFRYLLIGFIVVMSLPLRAQKLDSIFFNLYTDSLKKGTYNYINVEGRYDNGTYQPLGEKELKFSASSGKFYGNSLFIDSAVKEEKVKVKVTLLSNPRISKEIEIYIKKYESNERLPTKEEMIEGRREKADANSRLAHRFFHLLSIVKEFGQADVGKWMFKKRKNGLKRAGAHVGTGFCTFYNMKGAADGSRKYFGLVTLQLVNMSYLGDQFNAVPAAIVNAADKWRNIRCAGFGSQNGLSGRKHQGTVRFNAIVGKPLQGLHAVFNHRYFHYDVRVNCCKLLALINDGIESGSDNFSAYVAVNQFTNLFVVLDHTLFALDAFFGHKAGVGGYSVENSKIVGFRNLCEVSGVYKKLHCTGEI
jgi:hypothetical protein